VVCSPGGNDLSRPLRVTDPTCPVEDHLIGSQAEPRTTLTRPTLLASLRALTPLTLASDVEGDCGVFESIMDRIGDERGGNHVRPAFELARRDSPGAWI
jgi:hypothetical protein